MAWAGLFPDKIRIEILSAAGQPQISIAGNGRKIYFLFHHNRKIYKKPFNADLNKVISIPVKITHIIALLTGRIPFLEYKTVFLKKDTGSEMSILILQKNRKKVVEKIFIGQKTEIKPETIQYLEIFDSKGSVLYKIAWDGTRRIKDYDIPTGFIISDDDAMAHLQIDQYWADVPIKQSIFELTP